MIKAIFDYTLGITLLIITLPLWPILYILVKLDSKGPFIFRQKRTGKNLKPFTLYKIRTMQHHTKRWSTILTERDKRITKIGRILRRFKIDELPQLINIIKGEMSFVGPRPQVLEDTKNNTKLWKEAFKVKPGITGLATLLYHNREYKLLENAEKKGKSKQEVFISKIMPQKLKLNIFYVKKQNICLDIKILWWTFQDLFLKKILKRKRKKPL